MILFIADIHLSTQMDDPLNRTFLSFMHRKARQASHLYILGDLFDAWLGDDLGLIVYAPIIKALADYTQAGHQLSICTGNRDFLLKQYFALATGAQLLGDETEIQLGQEKAVLLHGDTLCTDDTAYLKLRTMLHNPEWQAQILQKSAAERIAFAQQLKQGSRSDKHQKSSEIMDVTDVGIEALLDKHPEVRHIIHGHTHRPAHHLITNNKHRWVVSDWDVNPIQILSWEEKIGLSLVML